MNRSQIDLVKKIELFAELSDEEAGALASLLRRKRMKKGEVVFHQTDEAAGLYLIAEGEVKISRLGRDGREVILALLRKGNFFGEMSLLDGQPRSATASATCASTLLFLDREEFLQKVLPSTEIVVKMLRELSNRIRAADQSIESLALGTVFDRLFHFLGHLGRRFPIVDEKVVISKRPTHQELAELVGASRETVTRCLTEMEKIGLIEIRKREIVLLPGFFLEESARSL